MTCRCGKWHIGDIIQPLICHLCKEQFGCCEECTFDWMDFWTSRENATDYNIFLHENLDATSYETWDKSLECNILRFCSKKCKQIYILIPQGED